MEVFNLLKAFRAKILSLWVLVFAFNVVQPAMLDSRSSVPNLKAELPGHMAKVSGASLDHEKGCLSPLHTFSSFLISILFLPPSL